MLRGMSKPGLAFACSLIVCLGGCAYGEMRQVLRAQVASEADCPDLVVQKASPYLPGYQPNQYTVQGCGIERVYTCKDDDGLVKFGSADCTYKKLGGAPAAPAAAPKPEAEPAGDDLGSSEDS